MLGNDWQRSGEVTIRNALDSKREKGRSACVMCRRETDPRYQLDAHIHLSNALMCALCAQEVRDGLDLEKIVKAVVRETGEFLRKRLGHHFRRELRAARRGANHG